VGRVIYLGGLGETGAHLSKHLSSRRDVEGAPAAAGVPVTVLRAAMIIGSGSASFEILRYLVHRLPVMITPKWVSTPCQPIAVQNGTVSTPTRYVSTALAHTGSSPDASFEFLLDKSCDSIEPQDCNTAGRRTKEPSRVP
jgi:hypothetical protein